MYILSVIPLGSSGTPTTLVGSLESVKNAWRAFYRDFSEWGVEASMEITDKTGTVFEDNYRYSVHLNKSD